MKLPSGYEAESHWAWSMSDPSFWSSNSSAWSELLDDTYLIDTSNDAAALRRMSTQFNFPLNVEGTEVTANPRSRGPDKARSDSTDSTESLSTIPSRDDAPTPNSTRLEETPRARPQRSLRRESKKDVVDIGRNLQRIKQRQQQQQMLRTESAESIEEEEDSCECTECKGRKLREQNGEQMPGRSIQSRLNAISF